jgi:hypothetical protein
MKTKKPTQRKGRKGKKPVKINREQIEIAVDEYLKSGGKITKLNLIDRNIKELLAIKEPNAAIDEFFR